MTDDVNASITILEPPDGMVYLFAPDGVMLAIEHKGETLVKVKDDGTIEYGPNYTPELATKTFWEALAASGIVRLATTAPVGELETTAEERADSMTLAKAGIDHPYDPAYMIGANEALRLLRDHDRLQARAEALEAALRPFAAEVSAREQGLGGELWRLPDDNTISVTVGQCRRARAALSPGAAP